MQKEHIKRDVEGWILSTGRNRKLIVPEIVEWKNDRENEVIYLSSELLLERFFIPEEMCISITIGENRCCIALEARLDKLSAFKRKLIDKFTKEAEGVKLENNGHELSYGAEGLDGDAFNNGCGVDEYLDNEIEDLNMTIVRCFSRHHEDYLRYVGPCHSQDDYGFQFFESAGGLYHGESKCFVYVVVKDNSRTHAVQLRIKDKDDNFGTRTLYPEKLSAVLEELKLRMPYTSVSADPVDKVSSAQDRAIRNITIDYTSDAGKEEAMTRLAEAWLVAIGRLPSLKTIKKTFVQHTFEKK